MVRRGVPVRRRPPYRLRGGLLAIGAVVTTTIACSLFDPLSDIAIGDARESGDAQAEASLNRDAGDSDAPADGMSTACDPDSPFVAPEERFLLGLTRKVGFVRVSLDELTMILNVADLDDAGLSVNLDLYIATRTRRDVDFGVPKKLDFPSYPPTADEGYGAISSDGRQLYLQSNAEGDYDIFVATRANGAEPFGTPTLASGINRPSVWDWHPSLRESRSELWFTSASKDGGVDRAIFRAVGADGVFQAPEERADLGANNWTPTISEDGLTIAFASSREGGKGDLDMWMATRRSEADPFGAATPLESLNGPSNDLPGSISPDGCRLYYVGSGRTSDRSYLVASRPSRN